MRVFEPATKESHSTLTMCIRSASGKYSWRVCMKCEGNIRQRVERRFGDERTARRYTSVDPVHWLSYDQTAPSATSAAATCRPTACTGDYITETEEPSDLPCLDAWWHRIWAQHWGVVLKVCHSCRPTYAISLPSFVVCVWSGSITDRPKCITT